MTNKEAMEILTSIKNTPAIKWENGADIAFDLAIKALEREADIEQAVVNIKISEEEIKQFKQMLREHNHLYSTTSNTFTFVEGASVERTQDEWIDEDGSYYANCSCCGYQINTHHERGYLKFCPNCGADMRGDKE